VYYNPFIFNIWWFLHQFLFLRNVFLMNTHSYTIYTNIRLYKIHFLWKSVVKNNINYIQPFKEIYHIYQFKYTLFQKSVAKNLSYISYISIQIYTFSKKCSQKSIIYIIYINSNIVTISIQIYQSYQFIYIQPYQFKYSNHIN
jgi:hypothetical protein